MSHSKLIPDSPPHTLNNISQEVCEHFEGILKMMNLLKQLVLSRVPAGVGSHQLRSSDVLALLPPAPGTAASEGLGSAIHSSCVELIQHIISQAQTPPHRPITTQQGEEIKRGIDE